MQSEIKTEGVDSVVSRAPLPKNDNDGRQKTDLATGAPLHVTELVAMDETGAEVIKVGMSLSLGQLRTWATTPPATLVLDAPRSVR